MRVPREPDPDSSERSVRLGSGAPEAEVRDLFDGMAGAYDDLRDLWYGYLFDRLHRFLERRYRTRAPGLSVLDVGCGTGQQSLPLAAWGAQVAALDLALQPLRIALRKASGGGRRLGLAQASAVELPFAAGAFDLVVSCGSVISFIPDYDAALAEMHRVLRPGGEIALEFEHRWSLDLLWPVLDSLSGGALRYRQPLSRTLANLFASTRGPVPIEYPFVRPDGVEVSFKLWLFGAGAIDRVLARHGFERVERHTIHAITNLLPSTALNTPSPSPLVARLFTPLAWLEDRVRDLPPFSRIGNSMFVVARRR